ncbi:MAG TPA: hypothetical protein VGM07_08965 [Stellaceae bacterium]|jgi:hypothetical protein
MAGADSQVPDDQAAERARSLYWRELVQLKVDCEYVQRYRDLLARRMSQVAVGRAIVSVGALGSWIAGLGYPQLWGGVIVVSQVAEAIQNVIPLAARERSLRAFAVTLDALLIDALLEWEDIQLGTFEAREITRRWHTLMKLRHEAETKTLTVALPVKPRIFRLAEQAAATYFETNYGTRPNP